MTTTVLAQAPERIDEGAIARIRDEGLNRSQVMDHVGWLSDVHGPRVTGSPALARASEWAMKRLASWGLANVHQETFAFGQGWTVERFSIHLLDPQVQPLIGYPRAWSPSTPGPIAGDVTLVDIRSDADFEKYRGTLRGKIVLTQPARAVPMLEGRVVLRMTPEELKEAASEMPTPARPRASASPDSGFQSRMHAFLLAEGAAAVLDRGSNNVIVDGGSELSWTTQRTDGGAVFPGSGGNRNPQAAKQVPSATLAVEHYNRMVRVLERGLPVRVEVNVQTRFHPETDRNGITTLAELPGTDLASEVVILGAHFDSTHAGSGATDNATGSAAMMEALRIITAAGLKPRRTIRLALWGGEEQGLLGSRAYVRDHFGDPSTMALKPEHERVAAYFNIDNGTGRVRGIWLQGNLAAKPIFDGWMKPLADLGVTTTGPRSVTGTDHVALDAVGLPAFQFIQERLEYNSRTHHSNMDVYDRVQRDDMVQMATVAAVFAYNAAMRDQKLPRKPLPLARPSNSR
ncbi:MAG: M20/M25/M40 family metallo-hydrolase [Steroidobacteraceae bacterium]